MVLVIDDNEDTLELLQVALSLEGFEVVVAHSVDAALALIRQRPPDAIVTDLHMPHTNGLQLCQAVGAQPDRRVPILVVSADEESLRHPSLGKRGACAAMAKPVEPRHIAEMLRRLLDFRSVCPDCTLQCAELVRCAGEPLRWSKHEA